MVLVIRYGPFSEDSPSANPRAALPAALNCSTRALFTIKSSIHGNLQEAFATLFAAKIVISSNREQK
jgi:hypothetical protein